MKARSNLVETYISLAVAAPGTIVQRLPGYVFVNGNPTASFCHFSAGFDLTDDHSAVVARTLRDHGQTTANFWVFVTEFCHPKSFQETLLNTGFEIKQVMQMLVAQPTEVVPCDPPSEATALPERLAVTQFMTDIFFWRMPANGRAVVNESTLYSVNRVFSHADEKGINAAVMISETEGTLGLYNLCVREDSRGVGLGKNLVRFVLNEAAREGKIVTLQCQQHLVDWYENVGFSDIGSVNAYAVIPTRWF